MNDLGDHTYSVLSGSMERNGDRLPDMGRFDDVITNFMRDQGIPGASVAVNYRGKLVYTQGYGIAGVGRRVHSDSLFRIASISKPITAIGVLHLCESGKLRLDDVVFGTKGILQQFKPTAKGDKRIRQITVRHLLQHSAGWDRDQAGDPVFWRLEKITGKPGPMSNADLIKYMMCKKLQFTPGRRHSYSNLGYLVLGCVIEAVTGKTYDQYITSLFSHSDYLPLRIGSEKKDSEDLEEVEYFNIREPKVSLSIFPGEGLVSPPYGSFAMATTGSFGGWVTSAHVLVKIADSINPAGLNYQSVLSEKSISEMLARPSYENVSERCWYGLGWDIQDGGKSWGHTGAMEGTSCTLMHHGSELTWAVLFNAWAKDMDIDGMVKFGLSSVSKWPLWQPDSTNDNTVVSTDEEEIVQIQVPLTEVKARESKMRSLGYAPKYIQCSTVSEAIFFNLIWRKSEIPWFLSVNNSHSSVQAEILTAQLNEFFVSFLETYILDEKLNYLLVFERSYEGLVKEQIVYCEKSATEHENLRQEHQKMGYYLIIQSVIVAEGVPNISAVFTKDMVFQNSGNYSELETDAVRQRSYYRITPSNFCHELWRFGKDKHYSLTYLKYYDDDKGTSVSAIWTKVKGDKFERFINYRRDDVSWYGFLYEMRESAQKNVRTKFICSYLNEGVVNFGAIWEMLESNH